MNKILGWVPEFVTHLEWKCWRLVIDWRQSLDHQTTPTKVFLNEVRTGIHPTFL
nr:MAG TPA: hypothetical protein [Caudoviricetes sp.]